MNPNISPLSHHNLLSKDPQSSPLSASGSKPTLVFIGGLMQNTTVSGLKSHLLQFIPRNKLGNIRILRDNKTKKSKGFGFFEISAPELLQSLLRDSVQTFAQLEAKYTLSGLPCLQLMNGRKLDIQIAKKDHLSAQVTGSLKSNIESRRLYVGNLSPSTDDQTLV